MTCCKIWAQLKISCSWSCCSSMLFILLPHRGHCFLVIACKEIEEDGDPLSKYFQLVSQAISLGGHLGCLCQKQSTPFSNLTKMLQNINSINRQPTSIMSGRSIDCTMKLSEDFNQPQGWECFLDAVQLNVLWYCCPLPAIVLHPLPSCPRLLDMDSHSTLDALILGYVVDMLWLGHLICMASTLKQFRSCSCLLPSLVECHQYSGRRI